MIQKSEMLGGLLIRISRTRLCTEAALEVLRYMFMDEKKQYTMTKMIIF